MDNKDFSDIGEQIRDSVQSALDSMDFQQLNRRISDTVNGALEEAKQQLRTGYNNCQKAAANPRPSAKTEPSPEKPSYGTARVHIKKELPRIKIHENGKTAGILFTVFGSMGIAISGILLLLLPATAMMIRMPGIITVTIFTVLAILTAGFGIMLGTGSSIRGRLKRLKTYITGAEGRMYCSIEELAEKTGRSRKFVAKDIKKMIQKQMLTDTYMDKDQKWVMFNRETYQQYLQTQQSLAERERQKKLKAKEAPATREPSKQEKEKPDTLIAKGEQYLKVLREANEAIPGEIISAKLSRLELVIGKIFDSVRKYPKQKDEIQKFMEYYLPTTVKLVNAYREFDLVDIEGENISSAKQEIEKTLDTINHAFEQLLDDLYQDAAFDITTDASVLQTMLAQEGWMGSDFKQEAKL